MQCTISEKLDEAIGPDDLYLFPHGGSCFFIPIGNNQAVKLYRTYIEAFSCWSYQKQAARFAPKVIDQVFKYQLDSLEWYGYITEVVTSLDNRQFINYIDEMKELGPICDELEIKLNKLGLTNHDWHKDNLGINSKGKYVIIDFSHVYELEERSLYA